MKKTIHWYEKRGKGSYFDPKLNHFIDDHYQFSEVANEDTIDVKNLIGEVIQEEPIEPHIQKGRWFAVTIEVWRKIKVEIKFTEKDLEPLNKIMTKDEAMKIWEEIIKRKQK